MSNPSPVGEPIIVCQDVHKWYGHFEALRGIDITINRGEVMVVFGPSGSGKSTFIRTLNRLEEHQSGKIIVDGIELTRDVRNIEKVRMEIGMVFQQFNLLARTSALDNVMLPLTYSGVRSSDRREKAIHALERVGLGKRLDHHPNELSGGQQQRVAIARALVNCPSILLADEPTGNLDSATTEEILGLLQRLNGEGKTIIMVTHEPDVGNRTKRIVRLKDGAIQSDRRNGE